MSSSAHNTVFEHAPTRSERFRDSVLRFMQATLALPKAPMAFALVSCLILCLACATGLSADDYVHTLLLNNGGGIAGFEREPWDIFRFADPQFNRALQDAGIFLWWDDPQAKLAFFRPLASLTHWVDHLLFPDSPALMHFHSVLWSALTFAGVIALYRRLIHPGWLLGMSVFLYVLDDARGWFTSWVAGRNTVVATALSVWVIWAHVRSCQMAEQRGERARPYLALALFPLALLAGEGSVAALGYIAAYALFMDSRGPRRALLSMWPYGLVFGAWQIAYRALGYGVAHSGIYTHPITDPIGYAAHLIERGPVLILAQLGGPWSDFWSSLFVFPTIRAVLYVAALSVIGVFAYLIWPVTKQSALVRFSLAGALLAILPAAATFPADRLLNWIGLGAAPAMASVIIHYLERLDTVHKRDRLGRIVAWNLVAIHLFVGPLSLTSRVRGNDVLRSMIDRADAGMPKDASISERQVFFLNPPAAPLALYLPMMRAAKGEPRPERQLVLSVGTTPLTVRRIGPKALALSAPASPVWTPGSDLLYGRDAHFAIGEERKVGDVRLKVTAVDDDGAPLSFEAHFEHTLDDERYLFLDWRGSTFGNFTPPALGESTVLAAADYAQVMFGEKGPIEAYHPLAGETRQPPQPQLAPQEPTASRANIVGQTQF